MPNSLRARLKNLVHKGVLSQKDLDRIVIVPIDGNVDLIQRQAVLEGLASIAKAKAKSNAQKAMMGRTMFFVEQLPSVSTEKTDAYKQGWHDAITTALKETHSVHTEEGHFRVVQEETLIGVGMAYEQVSTEKTGRWISFGTQGEINGQIVRAFTCSECGAISVFRMIDGKIVNGDSCANCRAKMETQEESGSCKDCPHICIMYDSNMKGCKDKMEGVEE